MEEKEGAEGARSAPQVPSPQGLCSQPPSCSVLCPGILWELLILWLCFRHHPSPLSILLATGVLSPQTQCHSPPPTPTRSPHFCPTKPWAQSSLSLAPHPTLQLPWHQKPNFGRSPGPPHDQKLGLNVSQVAEGSSQAFLMPPAHPSSPQSHSCDRISPQA